MHPDGTLASMRDINWRLGTLGLDEHATALVFSNSSVNGEFEDSHFIASLLYLQGQNRVSIWKGEPAPLLNRMENASGISPGLLRLHFYQSTLRDEHLLLDSDVRQFFAGGSVQRLSLSVGSEIEVYERMDGARIVLAPTSQQALTTFARLLATSTAANRNNLGVHIDGMDERASTNFGAPRQLQTWLSVRSIVVALVVFVMSFCIVFLLVKRKRGSIDS